MAEVSRKKGRKNRKHGRNSVFCKVYKLSHRRERNKAKRLNKHLSRHPGDRCAVQALKVAKAAYSG